MADAARPEVLITGASGALGRHVAAAFHADTDHTLQLWLHAGNDTSSKAAALHRALAPSTRVTFCSGELAGPDAFRGVDRARITHIVHCAALTQFNLSKGDAERVNVEGTRQILELACDCPRLEHVALVSSLYAAGLRRGVVPETTLPVAPFANHYEWSKWSSESLLEGLFGALPWQIFRVATALADRDDGCVSHPNAVHNTLRLLHAGLLPLLPGDPATPLPFVTLDFAADAIRRFVLNGPDRTVAHICHTHTGTPTLGVLVELALERFQKDPAFHVRRILRPLFCDIDTFEILASEMATFGSAVTAAGLQSVVPFARQLFAPKTFHNRNLLAVLDRYRAPDTRDLLGRVCDHLVHTRWRKGLSRGA